MIIVIRNSLGPRVPEWIKAVSSGDDDDGVAADDGGPTAVEGVVTVEYQALPGELILCGVLTSHYPGGRHTTVYNMNKDHQCLPESSSNLSHFSRIQHSKEPGWLWLMLLVLLLVVAIQTLAREFPPVHFWCRGHRTDEYLVRLRRSLSQRIWSLPEGHI